jgi:hypothetical protein
MKGKVKQLRLECYLHDAMGESDSSADEYFINEADRYSEMKKE